MSMRAIFQRTYDGATYKLTDEDLQVLGRGLWAEKHAPSTDPAEAAAIAWTWLNRFMLWPGGMSKWGSLAALIRAHSQPVNPLWRRDGKYCKPGGKYHGTNSCLESKLKWRDKMAYTPMGQTPIRMQAYAESFAAGDLPYYPYVDFAGYGPGERVIEGGEYYRTKEKASMSGWKPGKVEVIGHTPHSEGLSLPAKLGIGAFIVAVLWSGYQVITH